jgi:flagellar motor switch protein FliG
MAASLEFAHLSGKQKAAILMLALGEEHSGQILRRMSEDEIREIYDRGQDAPKEHHDRGQEETSIPGTGVRTR